MTTKEATWILSSMISDFGELGVAKEMAIKALQEQKVGKWIRGGFWSDGCGMGETYGYYYKCSECGAEVKNDYKKCGYNFCPNCGARMVTDNE